MDLFDAIAEIRKEFPHLDESEVRAAMDIETAWEEAQLYGRNKYRRAVETSKDRILAWLKLDTADFPHFDASNLSSLCKFVAGRRASCTWAVLRSLQMKEASK